MPKHSSKRPHKGPRKDAHAPHIVEATISTTGKGLGFVSHPDFEDDIRIEAGFLNTALNRDLVKVSVHGKRGSQQRTGEVIEVVKRARTKFVGVVEHEQGATFVVPDDKRMYTDIRLEDTKEKLEPGDKVFVELSGWNDPNREPSGKLIEVIGKKGDHEAEIRSIILENGIDDDFPADVAREAEEIWKAHETHTAEDLEGREDVREIPTCTIDPVDAKDFDDALSFKKLSEGAIEVGIHIADVSHYVRPGSALDREALLRAFSVYLVDRTIPMLPEVLSNDLCSLKPDVDRLAFSCFVTLDKNSNLIAYRFAKTIIRSQKRFSYEEAQAMLDAGKGDFFEALSALNTHAKVLRERRMRAGSIDFEQHEVRFELADDGVPLSAYTKERLDTHKLIEEFMLLANKTVAEDAYTTFGGKGKRHTFIYRTHDHPDREKLRTLAEFVKITGHTLELAKNGDVTGQALNHLFDSVEGTLEEDLIKTAGLRSMAKAAYTVQNIGHFGLALPAYTHFTSPIRRYADLAVHRLLFERITKNRLPNDEWMKYHRIAQDISNRELDVIGAERDSVKYKQVEYMSSRIGEVFDGVISGVSEWGFFVAELGTKAEGLVSLKTLTDDFYMLEPKKYRIVGKKTHQTFALGDKVRVRVDAVNLDKKTIDFSISE